MLKFKYIYGLNYWGKSANHVKIKFITHNNNIIVIHFLEKHN